MNFRWFISKTVRQATEMRRQVQKLLNHQRDLLNKPATDALNSALQSMDHALKANAETEVLKKQMNEVEEAANKWLKPYPSSAIRENIEVFLVAITVAVGIRTFYLQPFKIPTGSMQPTLYGITPTTVDQGGPGNDYDLKIPGQLMRKWDFWIHGNKYFHVLAKSAGQLNDYKAPVKFLLFNLKQEIKIGDSWQTIWFPDDLLLQRAGLIRGGANGRIQSPVFKPGDDVVRMMIRSGDHLFVDRFSYNFRKPNRGDIIVFATAGTAIRNQDQFYIKRMVAMSGETVSIGDDNHVVINGDRLDASTPRFENVYTFANPDVPPVDGEYFGHVNNRRGHQFLRGDLAPNFRDASTKYTVPDHSYLAFGDNTLNSADSRTWGQVPDKNVIGQSAFVYWPITSRFGWSHR